LNEQRSITIRWWVPLRDALLKSGSPSIAVIGEQRSERREGPTADVVASFDTSSQSRQLTPFDSVYVNRLQEAFEMAGTNVCDMQAIPDAILNGT
jgi:hypothetical protein